MLFEGGLNSKTAWATGSLLTWRSAQKTKHTKIYSRPHVGFPCLCVEENKLAPNVVWVTTSIYRRAYLHVPLVALQNNKTDFLPLHWRITHRCSLRTRRTRHPSLARTTLQEREQEKNKLPSLTEIEPSHHHGWQHLPLFQEYLVCHLFHQYPADPEKAAKQISGLHLAPFLNTNSVCSLTFSPFLPTAPCGPWIPLLPCRR